VKWDYRSYTQFWGFSENSFEVMDDERTVIGVQESPNLNVMVKENIIETQQQYTPLKYSEIDNKWIYSVHIFLEENSLFAGTFNSEVYRYNLNTGDYIWKYQYLSAGPINIIKHVNRTLFFGTSDHLIYTIDIFGERKHAQYFISIYKEVFNMHFFKFLRMKHVIEPLKIKEDSDEELSEEQKKKLEQEKKERDEKILFNTSVFYEDDDNYELTYPTGNIRGRKFDITDRRFIHNEKLVSNNILSFEQLKKIKKMKKKYKKDHVYYYRVLFTGLIRSLNHKDPTNYLDVSCRIKKIEDFRRKRWLKIQETNRYMRENIFNQKIEIPKKDDFAKEYGKRRSV
jgi:hypothetical protein